MSRTPPTPDPAVLGWKEFVELPDWGLELRAKLDTGARSSALHVSDLDEIGEVADPATGVRLPMVRFDVVLGPKSAPEHHEVETAIVRHQIVKDTRGRPEHRAVVRTRIVCGPLDTIADVTLTDRSGMNFRMLLGRRTLEGHALVDPAHGYRVRAPRGFGGRRP
ncbi:MAG: ATP-dependent zinc protease [Nitriliruptoraceae bacterium]|nr:ATP-dependent zinc protease [Nitriliruptoraceae bacterium]